jgi:hypothetical protein
VIRLDKTESIPSQPISDSEKDKIKKMLGGEKGKLINDWIANLRKGVDKNLIIGKN